MPDFRDEISLLVFVLVNTAVFASAWFFASRRMKTSRSQALLDAALLGYAVQYAAVGVPGALGFLNAWTIATGAMILSAVFTFIAWKTPVLRYAEEPGSTVEKIRLFGVPQNRRLLLFVVSLGLFVTTIIVMFALSQANVPILSNDALTYHFPAAAQWLQQGRISLFQTWFFNPANTYSPLAGSMFIAWLMAPFGSDVMARFVEVPPLIFLGIAMFRLCRVMGVRVTVAALIAGAAVLARPLFIPSMMGKDDLFVAFFFIASLVALSTATSPGYTSGAPIRLGISFGLLLATKYTALLSVPILFLAIDGPRWNLRRWIIAVAVASLIAGPWYLRNWIATGNPIFPMFSLFTTGRSDAFHSFGTAKNVILGGAYGLPYVLSVVLGIGWICSVPFVRISPIVRACVVGVPLGLVLFFWRSPFPEVRFVLPVFLLLFACSGIAIHGIATLLSSGTTELTAKTGRGEERREDENQKMLFFASFFAPSRLRGAFESCMPDNGDSFSRGEIPAIVTAAILFGCSLATLFAAEFWWVIARFAGAGLIVAFIGLGLVWWAKNHRLRWSLIGFVCAASLGFYSYVNWAAYCRNYRQTMFDPGGGYDSRYPELNELWREVDQKIPIDVTVAYTNMYLIYPLQGPALQRRLVYVPTRESIKSIADLGWLGSNISGEQLVPAANRAAVVSADQNVWLKNLRASGAKYLVIGKGGVIGVPPEAMFSTDNPGSFSLLFEGSAGWLYQFSGGPEGRADVHFWQERPALRAAAKPNTVQRSITMQSRNRCLGWGQFRWQGRFFFHLLIFLLITRGLIRLRRSGITSSLSSITRFFHQRDWPAESGGHSAVRQRRIFIAAVKEIRRGSTCLICAASYITARTTKWSISRA